MCPGTRGYNIVDCNTRLVSGVLPSDLTVIFPGGSDGKESACNAGDQGSIPGLGRSPGGGHSNLLQYSCLENPMDRGTDSPQGHTESDPTEAP